MNWIRLLILTIFLIICGLSLTAGIWNFTLHSSKNSCWYRYITTLAKSKKLLNTAKFLQIKSNASLSYDIFNDLYFFLVMTEGKHRVRRKVHIPVGLLVPGELESFRTHACVSAALLLLAADFSAFTYLDGTLNFL